MRKLRPTAVLLALLLATIGATSALASGDTPTPTADPTPTASPTPYPQSTITVRFVHQGEQVKIPISVYAIEADGVDCPRGQPGVVLELDHFSFAWPLPDADLVEECRKGPPTDLRITFNLELVIQIQWQGADITIDLEVPVDLVVSTPTPMLTPGTLPRSGGAPSQATEVPIWMAGLGSALIALSIVAFGLARWR